MLRKVFIVLPVISLMVLVDGCGNSENNNTAMQTNKQSSQNYGCTNIEIVNNAHNHTSGLLEGRLEFGEISVIADSYPCMLRTLIVNKTNNAMDVTVAIDAYTADGVKVGSHLDPSVKADPQGRSISNIPLWPNVISGASMIKVYIKSISGLGGNYGYIDGPNRYGKLPWDIEESNISGNDSVGGSDMSAIANILLSHPQASCRIIGMRMRNENHDYSSVAREYGCI